MKFYILSLSLLGCKLAQPMLTVTATLPRANGESQVVEFDIDSNICVQEIHRLYQVPYTEPTVENVQSAQNAHRDACSALNKVYVPLSESEAKARYNQKLGENLLDAIKEHQPELYPMIIEILAGKTAQNTNRLLAGS